MKWAFHEGETLHRESVLVISTCGKKQLIKTKSIYLLLEIWKDKQSWDIVNGTRTVRQSYKKIESRIKAIMAVAA